MLNKPAKSLCWIVLWTLVGCQKLSLRSQNPDDDDDAKPPKTMLIGDLVAVSGLHPIQIETVALVTNLDGTGEDPQPSIYRTLLLKEMQKRNVPNPNQLLQSPNTALVVVRAELPPVAKKGDTFDLVVALPENTAATSLKGGYLMPCFLSEQAIVPGRGPMAGHILGKAEGPILLSTGEGDEATRAGLLKRGRVLGGGVYTGGLLKKDRLLGLYVRNDYRGARTSRKIAESVGRRFSDYDHGTKRPLATAKTDQFIELKVHPRYKENYVRYIQVIRHIALNETQLEQRERMERLRKSLLVPETASRSAMELEAIGTESILILKDGLKSPNAEVRFYAAVSLAYLEDSSGAKVLAESARQEEAFRIFALAALATLDDQTTREYLRELMTKPGIEETNGDKREVWSAETRYGAFMSLWTLDKNDEAIRGESINGEFKLHVVKSDGEPMAHLTRHRIPQVVLFGGGQKLRTPLTLSAGRHIMITAPAGSETVTVSRFGVGQEEDRQITTSTRVADVIRAVGKLNAGYPDVAQMLVQAEKQSNLIGRLELDSLPQAGRIYYRPVDDSAPSSVASRDKTRVGKPGMVPNMFPNISADPGQSAGADDLPGDASSGMAPDQPGEASLADATESDGNKPKSASDKKPAGFLGLFRRQ